MKQKHSIKLSTFRSHNLRSCFGWQHLCVYRICMYVATYYIYLTQKKSSFMISTLSILSSFLISIKCASKHPIFCLTFNLATSTFVKLKRNQKRGEKRKEIHKTKLVNMVKNALEGDDETKRTTCGHLLFISS